MVQSIKIPSVMCTIYGKYTYFPAKGKDHLSLPLAQNHMHSKEVRWHTVELLSPSSNITQDSRFP